MKQCVTCGKRITYTFWVCSSCENTYGIAGIKYTNWPEWIKVLVKTSRRQNTISRREIAFSSIEEFDPFKYLTSEWVDEWQKNK